MTRALWTIAIAMAFAVAGCGDNFESPDPDTLLTDPSTVSLALGASTDVSAMFQRDGLAFASADVTWDSSNGKLATVAGHGDTATITAVGSGTVAITATSGERPTTGGKLTSTIVVTVEPPAVTRIAISPANPVVPLGATVPVHVTAFYNDQSAVEVTDTVSWTSFQPAVATVTGSRLTGVVQGDTTISASYAGKFSSTAVTVVAAAPRTITIAVPASLAPGATAQLTAIEHFTDATTLDVTATATWSSATPAAATVSSTGQATGVATGSSVITAALGTVSGTATLQIKP